MGWRGACLLFVTALAFASGASAQRVRSPVARVSARHASPLGRAPLVLRAKNREVAQVVAARRSIPETATLRTRNLARHFEDRGPRLQGAHGVFDQPRRAAELVTTALERARAGHAHITRSGPTTEVIVDMGTRVGFLGGMVGAAGGRPAATHIRLVLRGRAVVEAHPHHGAAFLPGVRQRTFQLDGGAARVRGVLFDLDGTLINSRPMLAQTLVDAARAIGLTVTRERALSLVDGRDFHAMIAVLKPGAPEADVRRFGEAFNAAAARHRGLIELMPGVKQELEHLTESGLRLGVATARPPAEARRILAMLGVEQLFSVVAGSGATGIRHKPEPDVLLGAAALMGLRSREILVVGDTVHDIHAAQRAGMPSVGVRWGMGGAAIETARATHVTDGVAGVRERLVP